MNSGGIPPKKILVDGLFLTKRITGVQRYAREVLLALDQINDASFRFVVALPRNDRRCYLNGLELFHDDSCLHGFLWQQARLPVLFRKLNADVLWSPCNIGPLSVSRQVVTVHDASVFHNSRWFTRQFSTIYRIIIRALGSRSLGIITDSQFSKDELEKYKIAPADRIQVVHAGVSSFFSPSNVKIFDFPYILSLGSRDPRKNIARLLDAWASMPTVRKGDRKLVVCGGDSRNFAAEEFSQVTKDVIMMGYVEDDMLPVLFSGAEAFIFPSLYEGFGLPPLEAMACGCPVVVSRAASLPEVCGEAAIYVDPLDTESIADGILKVLEDLDLKQALIEKGRKQCQKFTWPTAAVEHLKVFRSILGQC